MEELLGYMLIVAVVALCTDRLYDIVKTIVRALRADELDSAGEPVPWEESCDKCGHHEYPGTQWGNRTLHPDAYEALTQPRMFESGTWWITPAMARHRRGPYGKSYSRCGCGRYIRKLKKREKRRGEQK